MWKWIKRLFAPTGGVPPPVNRKERRTRQSIARRTRMHKPAQPEQEPDA